MQSQKNEVPFLGQCPFNQHPAFKEVWLPLVKVMQCTGFYIRVCLRSLHPLFELRQGQIPQRPSLCLGAQPDVNWILHWGWASWASRGIMLLPPFEKLPNSTHTNLMFSNESLPLGCISFRAISMESQSILFITSWDKDCLDSQYVFALSECPILWTVCCKLDKILEFEYHKAHGSWSIRNCLGWFIAFGRKPLARGSTSTFKASSWVEESTEQWLSWWPLTCNIFHCTEERSQSL